MTTVPKRRFCVEFIGLGCSWAWDLRVFARDFVLSPTGIQHKIVGGVSGEGAPRTAENLC